MPRHEKTRFIKQFVVLQSCLSLIAGAPRFTNAALLSLFLLLAALCGSLAATLIVARHTALVFFIWAWWNSYDQDSFDYGLIAFGPQVSCGGRKRLSC